MYKLHLILKYLRKRRIAWVSLLAVCLCTTMVLVVFSVMGGWLRMFRNSFHGLTGDVIVQANSLSGFAHYPEMIDEIKRLPEVDAAVPVIQTWGLININDQKTAGVQVLGLPIKQIGLVNEFPKSLWRQYGQWKEWADGGAIMPIDRYRLRGLALKWSPAEIAAVAKAAPDIKPKVEAEAAQLRQRAAQATNDRERQTLMLQAEDIAAVARLLDDPARTDQNGFQNAFLRNVVRRLAGPIVDDPAARQTVREPRDLLKFTDSEIKAIASHAAEIRDKGTRRADELSASVRQTADPTEQQRRLIEAAQVRDALDALSDPHSIESSAGRTVEFRTIVRDLVGDIVDSAEERLTASDAERKYAADQVARGLANVSFDLFLPPEEYKEAYREHNPNVTKKNLIDDAAHYNGMIVGSGVVGLRKDDHGKMAEPPDFYYRMPVKLTVMGVSDAGRLDLQNNKAERNYWIVDTSRTKVWQYDSNTVYVDFALLQRDLGMDEQEAEFEQTGPDGKTTTTKIKIPARTTEIQVRVKPEFRDNSDALVRIRNDIQRIADKYPQGDARRARPAPTARTWEQSNAKWLGAIEKELVLMIFLFGVISVVAVFLIFCIFYMIVVEKTRDIGIIKSVGATSSGVAGIFLGYGAAIGVVGAALGLLLSYLIVHNINELHDWLGRALNVKVWDPEVYAFDTIPNTMDWPKVWVILGIAVAASILGAIIPAIRAARLKPVEALRWE